ncbi:MAG TPA: hypothetical protein DEA50_16100, partial [Parvularcula sp.]|nr:hypothetical protein [Parvularcula sp.]
MFESGERFDASKIRLAGLVTNGRARHLARRRSRRVAGLFASPEARSAFKRNRSRRVRFRLKSPWLPYR